MRLTMNLEEMPHTTQTNLSPTNMFKGDSYHPRQEICLPSYNNNSSHCPRKAVKKTPSSMDQDTKEEEVLRIIFQAQWTASHKDQPLQHPHHKLEDHHRLPQSAIRTKITRVHQNAMEPPMDPPEHLQMAKAQELPKQGIRQQNLALELHQVQVLLHSLLTHPRTLSCVLHVAKVATGAEIVLIIISVTFVEWPPMHTHV